MNQVLLESVRDSFRNYSPADPLIVRSPGRINFIGEHTDYNDGFVLPAAIDKAIYLAAAKNNNSRIKLVSLDLNESAEFDSADLKRGDQQWSNYLIGTAAEMKKLGADIRGFTCVFKGDIPIGAGLSSSAAICSGLAFSLNELYSCGFSKKQLALIAQSAEHNFAGVKCGIMDQFINLHAVKNTVLKLDCRSLQYELYPFEYQDISIVLCDSGIKHSLASSEYNIRRAQCEEGAAIIRNDYPNVKNLRDVSIEMLESFEDKMKPNIYSRCLYVVEENERVLQACDYLNSHDLTGFGGLLPLTHEGLRVDYEVSIPEIDDLVYISLDIQGVFGSRMMGGGFGGCTINIVEKDRIVDFQQKMASFYSKRGGHELKFYICSIESGTQQI